MDILREYIRASLDEVITYGASGSPKFITVPKPPLKHVGSHDLDPVGTEEEEREKALIAWKEIEGSHSDSQFRSGTIGEFVQAMELLARYRKAKAGNLVKATDTLDKGLQYFDKFALLTVIPAAQEIATWGGLEGALLTKIASLAAASTAVKALAAIAVGRVGAGGILWLMKKGVKRNDQAFIDALPWDDRIRERVEKQGLLERYQSAYMAYLAKMFKDHPEKDIRSILDINSFANAQLSGETKAPGLRPEDLAARKQMIQWAEDQAPEGVSGAEQLSRIANLPRQPRGRPLVLPTQESIIREYIREALLAEYVVPMGYSLDRWLKKKDRENLSNKEYAEETKGDKWKVVHGKTRPKRKGKKKRRLRATRRGTPITRASTNLGYKRATNLHTAIKMSESPDRALREMMRRQREIDLLIEQLTGSEILSIALDVAADNPQSEFQFIRGQAEKLSKRANAMAVYNQGYVGREDLDAGELLQILLRRAVKNPSEYSIESLEAGEHEKSERYGYEGKDWDAYQDIDPRAVIRLRQQEEETADWAPPEPTPEDIALQGSTVIPARPDDTAALSEIYRKFGIY